MYQSQCSGCGQKLLLEPGDEPLWYDAACGSWNCRFAGHRLVAPGFKRFMHGPHFPFVCDPHIPQEARQRLGIDDLRRRWDLRMSDMLFDMLKDVA